MGSGKTSVAQKLSAFFPGYNSMDIDKEIENESNMSISEIFATNGEEYFRDIETVLLKKIMKNNKLILSTGGGVVLRKENRDIIKKNGYVFWLYANAEAIYERIKNEKTRPLINTDKPKNDILKIINVIMQERFALYNEVADVIVNTAKYSVEECVEEISKEYALLR